MIYEMFTVHDKAVGAFLPPFYCRSSGEAVRSFTASVNERDHQFNKYASDYDLYGLGQFDDRAGTFTTISPVRVISALEVLVPDDPFSEGLRQKQSSSPSTFGGLNGSMTKG